ncbi:MAG: DEAD/DEAH box helicase [Polyangia bacterium]
MSDYASFLQTKSRIIEPSGFEPTYVLHESLFPHQIDIVSWALRMGRCAVFADTGLGKTRMQVEWAAHVQEHTGKDVLILAPLAVAAQTAREGQVLDIEVVLCREVADLRPGICITNYDRLERFLPAIATGRFAGVVLDESSCIKHHDTKTLAQLVAAFRDTPYKLAATATPAPNDFVELGTHAEFLGVCSRQEMLAEFFVHDGGSTQDWRLKGHAESVFWKWVASWAALIRKPSDLGHADDGYDLPPLDIRRHVVEIPGAVVDPAAPMGLAERRAARKGSMQPRVAALVEAVNAEPSERWIVWCELNAEQDALEDAFGDDCISIFGSLDAEEKEQRLTRFLGGEKRVLIGKPSIFGFGINMQCVARMAFVGVSDSWESYYQAVRRCWRFGQTRPVTVHLFASTAENAVVDNLKRKEEDARRLAEELSAATRDVVRSAIRRVNRYVPYSPSESVRLPTWLRSAA